MSDYHQFLKSMSGIGDSSSASPQDPNTPTFQSTSMPPGSMPILGPFQSLGHFTGFPEPIIFNAPKGQRSRRKSAPGLDHIKHRRTRSGCYTCRSRRVKCDETHPICERCRKGKRECVYPDPPGAKSSSSSQTAKETASISQQASPDSSNDEDEEDMEDDAKLETIPDESATSGEAASQGSSMPPSTLRRVRTSSSLILHRMTTGSRQGSETPSMEGNKSSSPSGSTVTSSSLTLATYQFPEFQTLPAASQPEWAHLPLDLRFYLWYFTDQITHYHYGTASDSQDFFKSLPFLAVRHDALLYAVVGFAAYHHTLRDPKGKISQFLQYYNRSVTMLLNSLKRHEQHSLETLLTILQLATIEEYLGDWVNLMGHQKAAFEIITQMYTPESLIESPQTRTILTWYARFDVFVGLRGGFETTLPQEWFLASIESCKLQLSTDPGNLSLKIDDCSAQLRAISREMSMLYAAGSKGDIAQEVFRSEYERVDQLLRDWKGSLDAIVTDPAYLVEDFGGAAPEPNDIVDPFKPGVLFKPPLFPITILTCEWHSIVLMHFCQGAWHAQEQSHSVLAEHAFAICRIFETVELWPYSPKGSLLVIQAPLAMSTLFLPRDERHHMWMRKKFAVLETLGYVFPITMRTRMAELFRDPSCVHWWLPDDESFSPIIKSVRAFADERIAFAVSAQTENLREVRHVFARMNLGEGKALDDGDAQHGEDTTGEGGRGKDRGKGKRKAVGS